MIKNMLQKYEEIIKYLFFGVITTIASLIVYYFLVLTILDPSKSLELQIANVLSWTVGVLVAFFTNRKYVYKKKNKNKKKEFISFVLSRIFTLILDMVVMGVGVSILRKNDKIIKIISQIIVIVMNYILSKIIIFKQENNNENKN